MAQITTLTDRQSGAPLYPVTSTKAVFSGAGEDLDALLAGQKQDLQNSLRDYAQKTDLTDGLAKKQDTLSTSEDLQITDGNQLSLTAMAKMRLFIDMWNEACGTYGKYDPANAPDPDHPFYLNTLWLTYEEAVAVMILPVMNPSNLNRLYHDVKTARTHMPTLSYMSVSAGVGTFIGSSFEVIEAGSISVGRDMFNNCNNLRRVSIYAPNNNTLIPDIWSGCAKLENVEFSVVYRTSFSLSDSPLLSLPTAQRIVSKTSASGTAFTITVHQNVYAKLTGDTTNEAAAALMPEESAQWQQVLLDAVAKNISFATV